MRPGSHHDDWAATPQAAPQSLGKTPPRAGMVAPRHQNAGNDPVRIRPPIAQGLADQPERSDPGSQILSGTGRQIAQIPARKSLTNRPASGAAEPRADLVSSTTAKATFPWKPTNQSVRSPGRPDSGALPTCP